MHKISQKTVFAAQEHAIASLLHGKSVEAVGKRLQSRRHIAPSIGQSIEMQGKTLKMQAEAALELALELTEDDSMEAFLEALQAHINAFSTHIEAMREFQQEFQNQLQRANEALSRENTSH